MEKMKNSSKDFMKNLEISFGPLIDDTLKDCAEGLLSVFGKTDNILSKILKDLIAIGLKMAVMSSIEAIYGKVNKNNVGSASGKFSWGSIGSAISGIFGGFFADGGIVGGQNYNDGVVARVSSGEMVINQTDQKKLMSAIKGGSFGGGTQTLRLDGESLYMAISNYGKRNGRGGLLFERG